MHGALILHCEIIEVIAGKLRMVAGQIKGGNTVETRPVPLLKLSTLHTVSRPVIGYTWARVCKGFGAQILIKKKSLVDILGLHCWPRVLYKIHLLMESRVALLSSLGLLVTAKNERY